VIALFNELSQALEVNYCKAGTLILYAEGRTISGNSVHNGGVASMA